MSSNYRRHLMATVSLRALVVYAYWRGHDVEPKVLSPVNNTTAALSYGVFNHG